MIQRPRQTTWSPFGRNLSKFSDLSFSVLARALHLAEPTIFTPANIESMQTRGERQVSNARMQYLLEIHSDLPSDEVIDKEMRCKRKAIEFIATVIHDKGHTWKKDCHADRLHQARTLHLESQCQRQGPYRLHVYEENRNHKNLTRLQPPLPRHESLHVPLQITL